MTAERAERRVVSECSHRFSTTLDFIDGAMDDESTFVICLPVAR